MDGQWTLVGIAPLGAKKVDGLGEGVVVHQTGVHGKETHQSDGEATAEEGIENLKGKEQNCAKPTKNPKPLPYFVLYAHLLNAILPQNEDQTDEKKDEAMPQIPEHDTEEEGEGDHGEGG